MNSAEGDRKDVEMRCFSVYHQPIVPSKAYSNATYVDGPALSKNPALSTFGPYGSYTATLECPVYETVTPTECGSELPHYPPVERSELPNGLGHVSPLNVPQRPPSYRIYEELRIDLPPSAARPDPTLSMMRRLSFARLDRPFCQYFGFALESTFAEVESMLFLDIFILFTGLWILVLGVVDFNSCPATEMLPLTAVSYGSSAIVSSTVLIGMQFRYTRRTSVSLCIVLVFCRLLRLVMALICIFGVDKLYHNYPPEENDSRYCQTWLYWSETFVYLMYFGCFIGTLIQGIIFGLWYLC